MSLIKASKSFTFFRFSFQLFSANEGQTKFTATDSSTTADNTQVYLNGIFQEIGTDYTLGSPSVTIINPSTGLDKGDNLDIVITR